VLRVLPIMEGIFSAAVGSASVAKFIVLRRVIHSGAHELTLHLTVDVATNARERAPALTPPASVAAHSHGWEATRKGVCWY
jgi:hypothetical protein